MFPFSRLLALSTGHSAKWFCFGHQNGTCLSQYESLIGMFVRVYVYVLVCICTFGAFS